MVQVDTINASAYLKNRTQGAFCWGWAESPRATLLEKCTEQQRAFQFVGLTVYATTEIREDVRKTAVVEQKRGDRTDMVFEVTTIVAHCRDFREGIEHQDGDVRGLD